MRDLFELLQEEAQARKESLLNESQFLHTLEGAAEIFREDSLRLAGALPTFTFNDMGVLQSRKVKVVDMGGGQHGMEGTGGNEDLIDITNDDQLAYAMWHNGRIPKRIYEASKRDPGLDLLKGTGRAIGEILRELENELIVKGLGPLKGLTNAPSIQTFASAGAWTTAGIFWQDIVKARAKIRNKKVPVNQLALLVNPLDMGNAFQTFSNTDVAQLDKATRFFAGGIFENTNVTEGKAYVYAKTPTVCEYDIYQDLSVFPLPMTDEDPRLRGRIIGSTHFPRGDGICEITSVEA